MALYLVLKFDVLQDSTNLKTGYRTKEGTGTTLVRQLLSEKSVSAGICDFLETLNVAETSH